MSDAIDQAQDREQTDRDFALRAHALRVASSFSPRQKGIDTRCIDCEQAIEPERLKVLAGKTSRCAHCAHVYEKKQKGFRR